MNHLHNLHFLFHICSFLLANFILYPLFLFLFFYRGVRLTMQYPQHPQRGQDVLMHYMQQKMALSTIPQHQQVLCRTFRNNPLVVGLSHIEGLTSKSCPQFPRAAKKTILLRNFLKHFTIHEHFAGNLFLLSINILCLASL